MVEQQLHNKKYHLQCPSYDVRQRSLGVDHALRDDDITVIEDDDVLIQSSQSPIEYCIIIGQGFD